MRKIVKYCLLCLDSHKFTNNIWRDNMYWGTKPEINFKVYFSDDRKSINIEANDYDLSSRASHIFSETFSAVSCEKIIVSVARSSSLIFCIILLDAKYFKNEKTGKIFENINKVRNINAKKMINDLFLNNEKEIERFFQKLNEALK